MGCAGDVGEGLATGADMGEKRCDVDVVIFADGQRGKDLDGLLHRGFGVIQVSLEGLECVLIFHLLGLSLN